MEIKLLLPGGAPASHTEIGLATLDLDTLSMRIEISGFDQDGNKLVTKFVHHQLEILREVTREEIEDVITRHLLQNTL